MKMKSCAMLAAVLLAASCTIPTAMADEMSAANEGIATLADNSSTIPGQDADPTASDQSIPGTSNAPQTDASVNSNNTSANDGPSVDTATGDDDY